MRQSINELKVNEDNKDLIVSLIDSSLEGMTISEMRKRSDVLDLFKTELTSLILDSELVEILKKEIKSRDGKYAKVSKPLIELFDVIESF